MNKKYTIAAVGIVILSACLWYVGASSRADYEYQASYANDNSSGDDVEAQSSAKYEYLVTYANDHSPNDEFHPIVLDGRKNPDYLANGVDKPVSRDFVLVDFGDGSTKLSGFGFCKEGECPPFLHLEHYYEKSGTYKVNVRGVDKICHERLLSRHASDSEFIGCAAGQPIIGAASVKVN